MIIDTSFKWPVAADYAIEKSPARPNKVRSRGWAKWSRVPAADTILGGERSPGVNLVAKGNVIWKRPFRVRADLSQEFLRLIESNRKLDEAVLQFARKYGMLTDNSEPGSSEPLTLWQDLAKSLRKARLGSMVTARLGLQELRLTRSGAIALVPNTLKSAIECEAFLLGRGAELKQCPGCGGVFEVGGKSGKHAHAEYCSDDCRYKFHNGVKAAFIAGHRRAGMTAAQAESAYRGRANRR